MSLQKEIIVIGDTELGGGTLTDDFISDNALSELILELRDRPHPVDLVLNGDTFDFLKCPLIKDGRITYPRHITKEVSLAKLELIFQAHQKIFDSLTEFLQVKNKSLYFTFGNHDPDLIFPAVQQKLKERLNDKGQVHFALKYHRDEVYIEHGMQYDSLNKINFKKAHLTHNGQPILNLSWVSLGIIHRFLHIKEDHPFLERIHTHKRLFVLHPPILSKLTYSGIGFFLKSCIYYPWRYFNDPTYTFPRGLIREFFRRVKKGHWDVDKVVRIFKRNKRRTFHRNKIYVLSHVHEPYLEKKGEQTIIHPSTWRDEYDLDKHGKLIPRIKHYVQILMSERGLECQLIEYPVKRNTLDLVNVLKDEVKYIREVAEEEGFKLKF
ncbi:MAG: metallophosphoesterase [Candidatus Woesearchaeota archaeon]|jgi:hypothetical protein